MKTLWKILLVTALTLPISVMVFADINKERGSKTTPLKEEVTLEQCPEKVQEAINTATEGATIIKIMKITRNDLTMYKVVFTKDGETRMLALDAEGNQIVIKTEKMKHNKHRK